MKTVNNETEFERCLDLIHKILPSRETYKEFLKIFETTTEYGADSHDAYNNFLYKKYHEKILLITRDIDKVVEDGKNMRGIL